MTTKRLVAAVVLVLAYATASTTTALASSRPTVSGFALSPSTFSVARAGATAASAQPATRIRFRLSKPATVTISIARKVTGRKVGRRCVKSSSKLRSRPACARYVLEGRIVRSVPKSGQSAVAFSGRLHGAALVPGRYRATIRATDRSHHRSKRRTAAFTVTKQSSAPSAQPVSGGPGGGVCSGAANAAGGPDPWGGCWPGPQNTGVPAGVVLSPYGGPCTVTTNGAVIDRALVNCSLTIRASGVQITNSKINGTVYAESPYSFSIADSEVDAGGPQNSGIGNENFTATRVHVHGGYRGIWCDRNCTVQDSWVHGQATDPSGAAHESGVRMGEGSIIRHNSLLCDAPDVPPDAGCSADLTGYGDFAPVRDNTIQRNLFLATTGGACAYGGSSGNDGSKPYGNQAANIVFAENIFQRRGPAQSSGKCGYWFPITDFDKSRPGNQWTNNQWADGGTINP